jgi:hypothetical protein
MLRTGETVILAETEVLPVKIPKEDYPKVADIPA